MNHLTRKSANELSQFAEESFHRSSKEFKMLRMILDYNDFSEEAVLNPFYSVKENRKIDYLEWEAWGILRKKFPYASTTELLRESEEFYL